MNFGSTIYGLGSHGWTSIPWQVCESYLHPLGNGQTYCYRFTKNDRDRTIEAVKFSQNTNNWLTALKIASYILTVFTLPLAALMIKGLYRLTHKIEIYSGGGKPNSLNSNNAYLENNPGLRHVKINDKDAYIVSGSSNKLSNIKPNNNLKPNHNSGFNNPGSNNYFEFNNDPNGKPNVNRVTIDNKDAYIVNGPSNKPNNFNPNNNLNPNHNSGFNNPGSNNKPVFNNSGFNNNSNNNSTFSNNFSFSNNAVNYSNNSGINNKPGFNNNSSVHAFSNLYNPSPQIKPIGNPVSKPEPKPEPSDLQPLVSDLQLLASEPTLINSIENSIEYNSQSFMDIRKLIDTGKVKLNSLQEEILTCPSSYEPYLDNGGEAKTPVFLIQEGLSASFESAQDWNKQLNARPTKSGLLTNATFETWSFEKNIGLIKQARVIDEELCWIEPISGAKLGGDGFKNPYFCPKDGYTYDLETFIDYIKTQYEKGNNTVASPGNPEITFDVAEIVLNDDDSIKINFKGILLYPNKDFFKLVNSKDSKVTQPSYEAKIIKVDDKEIKINSIIG